MLKWSKDGTAKCGMLEVSVNQPWKHKTWVCRYELWEPDGLCYSGPISKTEYKTEALAKEACEKWLSKQAKAMLRDLGEA